MRLNFQVLSYFLAIANEESITAACEVLLVTGDFNHKNTGENRQKLTNENDQKFTSHIFNYSIS